MSVIRQDRINEEVRKVTGEIIHEMKDPRVLEMATITRADVTADLRQARLFVSVYEPDEALRRACVKTLNHAAGFIAREIGRRIQLRRLPALKFELDTSIEYSAHINELLNSLHSASSNEEGVSSGEDGHA
ncbi:MAG: 30S ribosome-binding factor RbfA [Clostridiales bacterium]|jgi:ribosome-binding factor A|nr:30S ribosome-binding factor RbfA [Clostridiales bacterium]